MDDTVWPMHSWHADILSLRIQYSLSNSNIGGGLQINFDTGPVDSGHGVYLKGVVPVESVGSSGQLEGSTRHNLSLSRQ